MRVLVTATFGLGHVLPLVPLARAMIDGGDSVLWATAPSAGAMVTRAGFDVVPAGLDGVEAMARFAARTKELADLPNERRPDVIFPFLFGETLPRPMVRDVIEPARTFAPDLVVSESAEFAGPLVAALLGVPGVTHALGPLTPEHRVRAAGECIGSLWLEHGLTPGPYGGRYDHAYLDPYPASLQLQHPPHVGRVQPIRPGSSAVPGGEGLPAWLRGPGDPVVYVTFGTVFNDAGTIRPVLAALATLPVRVIATVGSAVDPSVLGEQPANFHIARYIPQEAVLPHCAVVLSHAGSGTFLAAAAAGVPQLLLPQGADQFQNAQAGAAVGLGISLPPSDAAPGAVAAAVRELLHEDRYRAAAATVAAEIAAMPAPATVAETLRELVA